MSFKHPDKLKKKKPKGTAPSADIKAGSKKVTTKAPKAKPSANS